MEAGDEVSDSASVFSVDKSVMSTRRASVDRASIGRAGAASVSGSVVTKKEKTQRRDDKPVSSLRLKQPVVMPCDG